ncbi:MAG TPA: hypothetical protein VGK16_14965 [Candidatus Limnocylindrales bacterium]|jgi:hypothetical protein
MNTDHIGTPTRVVGIRLRTLAVMVAIGLATLTLGAATASADSRAHRNAETTFTKWITAVPGVPPVIRNMAGIVGGDVGSGTFTGEVLSVNVTGTTKVLDAAYHFSGSTHAFSASVHVVQSGLVNGSTAVITGRVTEGWLKDNLVAGQYTQVTCEQSPGVLGTCFQGTLDILRGTKPGN